ncbi:hypothetical protein B0T18DRAFT_417469 [Schizothecium vesticola]|uniref:Secreted protein n=1 Tax=Schizothecium vesticola TaxID=314040 RepID=A0AA40JYJ3_9PEZI|nr:hypothetical protein B0T18DRAFT_417469 [Schizothecium vesticola]
MAMRVFDEAFFGFFLLRPGLLLTAPIPPLFCSSKPCGSCRNEGIEFVSSLVVKIETCNSRGEDGGVGEFASAKLPCLPRRCQAASPCVPDWPRAWQLRAAPISIVMLSWDESICQGHRGFAHNLQSCLD